MKKTLIALAVVSGSIASANAAVEMEGKNSTTLYGSLGYSVTVANSREGVVDSLRPNNLKKTHWDLQTKSAKIGVKGTEVLANGLEAFFKYEFGVDDATRLSEDGRNVANGLNSTKKAYLGFRGDFGQLTLGKQGTLLDEATGFRGGFNQLDLADIEAPGTVSKAVNYLSPNIAGLTLGGSIVLDGQNQASKGADAFEVGALYEANGINASAAYLKQYQGTATARNGSDEFLVGNVSYKTSQYQVGVGAQSASSSAKIYDVAGEWYNGASTFRAGLAYVDNNSSRNDALQAALGYQYKFSPRTKSWVEANYARTKNEKDGFQAVVGVRHDF